MSRRPIAALCGLLAALAGLVGAAEQPEPAVVVLDTIGEGAALNLGGQNKLLVRRGGIRINSPHRTALFCANSQIQVDDGGIGIVGGFQLLGEATCTPQPQTAEKTLSPFRDRRLPGDFPSVSGRRMFVRDGATVELRPGAYYGGLSLGKGAQVTMQPGIYLIYNGDFYCGGANLTGRGVCIATSGEPIGKLIFGNDSKVDLGAPTEGPYAGLVLVSSLTEGQGIAFNGTAARLDGAIYSASAQVGVFSNSKLQVQRIAAWRLVMNTAATLEVVGGPLPEPAEEG